MAGAVAPAARDDARGRFSSGDAVGFFEEEIIVWGTPREALKGVLDALARDSELITCLSGEAPPLDDETIRGLVGDDIELELSVGGPAELLVAAQRRVTGAAVIIRDRCQPARSPARARSSVWSSTPPRSDIRARPGSLGDCRFRGTRPSRRLRRLA